MKCDICDIYFCGCTWERFFISMYFEISGAVIDMNFLSSGEAGAKSTKEDVHVKDWGGVLSYQFL